MPLPPPPPGEAGSPPTLGRQPGASASATTKKEASKLRMSSSTAAARAGGVPRVAARNRQAERRFAWGAAPRLSPLLVRRRRRAETQQCYTATRLGESVLVDLKL